MGKRRHSIRIVALLLVPPAIGMLVGAQRATATLFPEGQPIPSAPSRWVAFTADLTVTKPGNPSVVGRFFRSSDGSRRMTTGPALDDIRVIYIMNALEGQEYIYTTQSEWSVTSVPGVTPGHYLPPTVMPTRPDISEYPYRLALKRGQSGSLTATSGFQALQTSEADGTTKLTVPELNMFEVVKEHPTGRREAYTNIELVEPSPELFRPPAGVAVLRRAPAIQQ
jgi:hypothetical protein